MMPDLMPRSYLFAPGAQPRLLAKSLTAGADAVVFDLEDAVAPGEKDAARKHVADAIAGHATAAVGAAADVPAAPEIWVRVNALSGDGWLRDLDAVIRPGLTGVRVPKAESRDALAALAERIEALEAARGLERGAIRVVPTVESAAGLMRVPELATAPRIAAFAFGATDFAADLGAEPGPDERETLLARSWLVLASRAAGVGAPIASVHTKLDDEEGLRRTTMEARRLGFWGRSCIHPKQLAIVHEVFTPTADQIADARAVLEAFQQQVAAGQASFRLGDRFVDRAVAARAARLLARVERPLA